MPVLYRWGRPPLLELEPLKVELLSHFEEGSDEINPDIVLLGKLVSALDVFIALLDSIPAGYFGID